ncbi:MAG TPA: hypothetical protein VK900_07950, partial [Anaerolineales bacterium]|nr:hypothetical protein [Anaerolineales bacterium]
GRLPRDPATLRRLVEYTQGYGLDNKALAHDLQEQLCVICVTFTCSRNRSNIKLAYTRKRSHPGAFSF